MGKFRIVLADDLALVRAGLKTLIQSDPQFEVIGEVGTAYETIRLVRQTLPDLLITEVKLEGQSAFDMMIEIGQTTPATRILVLSATSDQSYIRSVLAVGGMGYVTKNATPSDLFSAIAAIRAGRVFISASLQTVADLTPPSAANLSPREHEVLVLLAQGLSYSDVAAKLHIGVRTIGTYRTRIAEKLGLARRADLVRYALEMGLLKRT